MKTIIIFEEVPESMVFFVIGGDYARFDKVYTNAYTEDKKILNLQEKLNDLIYDEQGQFLHIPYEDFPLDIIVEAVKMGQDVKVIRCGFYL